MKYIIMCGGQYLNWETPRQLLRINGESIVERTIRLLRENGVEDIAISTENPAFEELGVPILTHENSYKATGPWRTTGWWTDAFYLVNSPVCYLFGDVVFSPNAIKTIVSTETDDIQFFASAPPFASSYPKKWAEPFALKVVNYEHLKSAITKTKKLANQGRFKRTPIMWELWQVIKDTPLNEINYHNYVVINDYTCDIDYPEDVKVFEDLLKLDNTKMAYMIHTMPKRKWYVDEYLIPSMLAQGIKKEDIRVYNDVKGEGNLKSWLKSCLEVDDDAEGTWHLQDDIIISSDFKEMTEKYNSGIVAGIKTDYDNDSPSGIVPLKKLWWTFPCIRIPNKLLKECREWIVKYIIGNPVYKKWWTKGGNDDLLFRQYLKSYYKDMTVLNLEPNIADHIDYLIGGSVNSQRTVHKIIRSKLWREENLVEELESKLKARENNIGG